MVQKEARLQAIIRAGSIACDGCRRPLIDQMNHPGASRAPVALEPRATLPVVP
jgi:LSD1 subclass zinc finger protein